METQPKKKWPKVDAYKYRKIATLTKPEGAKFDRILARNGCANISQLCKRIVRGELELKPKERAD